MTMTATERTLRVQEIETMPWTTEPAIDGAGMDDVLDPTISEPARALIEAAEPHTLRCRACGAHVGLTEVVTEDTYGREIEGYGWRALTVVSVPDTETAWLLCEDCAEVLTP